MFSFLPWNEITTATLAVQLRPTTLEQFPVAGFPYLIPSNKDQTMRHEALNHIQLLLERNGTRRQQHKIGHDLRTDP